MNDYLRELYITLTRPRGSLVGFASFVYRNEWFFSDIAIHLTKSGDDISLAFPDKTLCNGRRMNVFFPINKEIAEAIKIAIADEYFKLSK